MKRHDCEMNKNENTSGGKCELSVCISVLLARAVPCPAQVVKEKFTNDSMSTLLSIFLQRCFATH